MKNIKTILLLPAVLLFFLPAALEARGKGINPAPESRRIAVGGPVKGIFDPVSTPMTWTDLSEGGKIGTETFTNEPSAEDSTWAMRTPGVSDIERYNLNRGMRLPSLKVSGGGCSNTCPER